MAPNESELEADLKKYFFRLVLSFRNFFANMVEKKNWFVFLQLQPSLKTELSESIASDWFFS